MGKTEYGLQMYSLRDITGEDLKGALKQVAEMGYRYIEFAGFFGNAAEDVKAWLDEYGLVCSGTHTGRAPLEEDAIDATIDTTGPSAAPTSSSPAWTGLPGSCWMTTSP